MPSALNLRSISGATGPPPGELLQRIEAHLTEAASGLEVLKAQIAVLNAPTPAPPVAGVGSVQPKLLTVRQTAAVLGVGQSTVHNLIRTGELGSRKIGGARRVPVEDLDAFVARLPSRRLGA
jgi:excisionase family DNA binding protein